MVVRNLEGGDMMRNLEGGDKIYICIFLKLFLKL